MLITIRRYGDFQLLGLTHQNDRRCAKSNALHFRYNIELGVDHTDLDRNGFVIDRDDIHRYIEGLFTGRDTLPSCEVMAVMILHRMEGLMNNLQTCKLTLGHYSDYSADITIDWVNADEEPRHMMADLNRFIVDSAKPKPPKSTKQERSDVWSV